MKMYNFSFWKDGEQVGCASQPAESEQDARNRISSSFQKLALVFDILQTPDEIKFEGTEELSPEAERYHAYKNN